VSLPHHRCLFATIPAAAKKRVFLKTQPLSQSIFLFSFNFLLFKFAGTLYLLRSIETRRGRNACASAGGFKLMATFTLHAW